MSGVGQLALCNMRIGELVGKSPGLTPVKIVALLCSSDDAPVSEAKAKSLVAQAINADKIYLSKQGQLFPAQSVYEEYIKQKMADQERQDREAHERAELEAERMREEADRPRREAEERARREREREAEAIAAKRMNIKKEMVPLQHEIQAIGLRVSALRRKKDNSIKECKQAYNQLYDTKDIISKTLERVQWTQWRKKHELYETEHPGLINRIHDAIHPKDPALVSQQSV